MAWSADKYSYEQQEEKVSKFNSAGLINATLEKLWGESYSAMASGDYRKWNVKLDSIWAILGGDVDKDSPTDKEFRRISKELYETGSFAGKVGTGFKKIENPNNSLQYHLLLEKALFLRRLQNKQGKGTAYADGDEDDWE